MEVIFLGTGTSQGVPIIACDCAVCTSTDARNQRTRASIHVVMDGLHVQVDAVPEFRLQCIRERIRQVDFFILTHGHADHILGIDETPERRYGKDVIDCGPGRDTVFSPGGDRVKNCEERI